MTSTLMHDAAPICRFGSKILVAASMPVPVSDAQSHIGGWSCVGLDPHVSGNTWDVDGQGAAMWHGITGIDSQVEQDLFELDRIGP